MDEFISEDDLKSFDGWLRYQATDATTITSEELATWGRIFEDARQRNAVNPEMGLRKLQPILREYRYAVVVNDFANLQLTLWVERSRKGEFFIMLPRGDGKWNFLNALRLSFIVRTVFIEFMSDSLIAPSHSTRVLRPVNRWITTNTTPIANRIQEIWTAIAATPARFRAPAINPTTRNISAK